MLNEFIKKYANSMILKTVILFIFIIFSNAYAEIIAGYQGWFGCPNDFGENRDWQHWFIGKDFTVDLLPDVSIYPENVLCDTGRKNKAGQTVKLFSSQNKEVVKVHVELAEQYGIDVLAVQRFIKDIDKEKTFKRRTNILNNIIDTTRDKKIKFFVMYDISGADEEKLYDLIVKDINYLKEKYALFKLKNYYLFNDKPLIAVWGFGFADRPGDPNKTLNLIKQLKEEGFSILGGIPSRWRTLNGDSKSELAWKDVYLQYDILSPWMVSRFKDEKSMQAYYENIVKQDISYLKNKNKKYLPVVFPGFSWYNLQTARGNKAEFNYTKRNCGEFFKNQLLGLKSIGVKDFYIAMLDEFDEGTAVLPAIINKSSLPENDKWKFVIPEHDNCKVDSSFYLLQIIKNYK